MMFFYNDEYYFSLDQFMSGLSHELGLPPTDFLISTIVDSVNAYVFMNRLATMSKDGCVSKYFKVKGYCRIELEKIKNNPVPKVNLYICDESGVSNDYINYKVDSPIHMRDLKSKGALKIDSYRRYLNELGVTLGVKSIEGLMFADDRFPWFKKDKDSDLMLKRIIDWYIAYFPDVNQESIFDIAERVQLNIFNLHGANKKHKMPAEKLIKLTAYKMHDAFNDTPVTVENMKCFKNALPDVWRKELFNISEPPIKGKTLDFDDDTPSKLYAAGSVYDQVWKGFNSTITNLPSKSDIVQIVKELGFNEPNDIQAIIRLSMPDGLVLGGHKNPDKENWMSLSERNTIRLTK